ncbi:hypothetical protein FB446DRAFT_794204 [Lentinula raphanica]|nr:hypothetical protein FB446DRAFT_794204 [Lentinula raphanica]
MPPKSSTSLSSLLKPKKLPEAATREPGGTTGQPTRPTRESKIAAMQNKVWMADGPAQTKRTSDAVSDSHKTHLVISSSVGGQKGANTNKSVKNVKTIEQELDMFTDEEGDLQDSEHLDEDNPQGGSDDEAPENEDDVYDLDVDLNAERARSGEKTVKIAGVIDSDSEEEACILPKLDDENQGLSDAPSSTFEMSLVSNNSDDDDENDKKKQVATKRSTARDAKYESERPFITLAPTITTTKKSLKKKTHKRNHSATDDSDPNMGWPIEAHLKFPDGTKMQRTISLRIQPQAIQDILHEAITLASGLSMFEEAFPSSAQQLAQSYTSIVSAATSLKHPLIANRIEKDDIFRKHLTSYVTGRVGKMRVNVKEAAVSVVPGMYGILRVPTENGERKEFVKDLLTKMNFIFPRKTITDATGIQRNKPYLHQAIITVLHDFLLQGKTDNAKEVPHAMLSLVVIAVFAAIKEWEGGKDEREKQEFVASTFADQYTLHTALINEKIRNAKVGNGAEKYHTLMARLYREAAKM